MKEISIYLCFLLRHHPEKADLDMNIHGWVSVDRLIAQVNKHSEYKLNKELLEKIVSEDKKGRYKFDEQHRMIKCCQGHSIPWVEPELIYCSPPQYLYHGTNTSALKKIEQSGAIMKMNRHAVHMQADKSLAWQSAERWHLTPVVIKIDALSMYNDGYKFGVSDNHVWCTNRVPVQYICDRIYEKEV